MRTLVRYMTAIGAALVVLATQSAASSAAVVDKNKTDPLLSKQWALQKIQAIDAWSVARGKGVVVAVLDTGLDLDHPDFQSRRVLSGINVLDPSQAPEDDNGHGTKVAGIIAATANNAIGIAGIAPQASILPIKVCDAQGFCEDADIARGIQLATEQGVDAINLSIGLGLVTGKVGDGAEQIRDAVEEAQSKGIIVIAAGGNLSVPVCQEPASYALCVGATGPDDSRAVYSNGDATMLDEYLVAPGGDGRYQGYPVELGSCSDQIISTFPVGMEPSVCPNGNAYASGWGTSEAAPHVSGVVALLLSIGLQPGEVVKTVLETADDLGSPGRDPVFGYGRVNALRAVEAAALVT